MSAIAPSIGNPLRVAQRSSTNDESRYQRVIERAAQLRQRPQDAGRNAAVRQHAKGRMTVWERIALLSDCEPEILYQNWGMQLDGASLVTALIEINGRKVAFYGHDFTVRAGSMDATNGAKLVALIELATKWGIPLIGINDSAGAYVPAGVGGLDGYAQVFAALRRASGVVPSIMCMFGFNAGGGSYLPRQGSFMIQPQHTFFGLTGPAVVESVLGERISADELGGPAVHSQSGVADFVVSDESAAIALARKLLDYLPDNNHSAAPLLPCSDAPQRETPQIGALLQRTISSPTGFNTPLDSHLVLQELCDHGDYLETQAERACNTITAFTRLNGHVVGIVANNSAVASGQIDIDAAYKNARFIRFCNLYNLPVLFIEDTTGFLPGQEQEMGGIVQAGRAMLDAIIDLRTPRILVLLRNAFGGAYAAFNNYAVGADLVLALPTTRVAVMGSAGVSFVYKKELQALASDRRGTPRSDSAADRAKAQEWMRAQRAVLAERYEKELMNADEALSLGSISRLVMPETLRADLIRHFSLCIERYQPQPMSDIQREFH